MVRDAVTGARISVPLAHPEAVRAVAVNGDGSRILTGGPSGTARLWNATTGELIFDPIQTGGALGDVGFSPEGTRMLTAGFDGNVGLRDVLAHRGALWWCAGSSPDGRTVVTACDDWTVRVWDVATAKPIGPALAHEAGVRMVAFADQGQILTGTTVGTVRIWDASISPMEENVERITVRPASALRRSR